MKKYGISLFLVLILLFGLMVPAASAQVPDAQTQSPELLDAQVVAKGIDVSHHQGTIDWDTAAGQIDFAVIRCGYGGNLSSQDDRQWSANVAACERLGIPYGVYLYSYAATDDEASDEAQHVLRLLQGHTPQLPVYLDLEDSVISSSCSAADILRHVTIFCNAIQAAGYRAGVYANRNWWTTLLTDPAYDQWERWVAVWASQTNYNKSYQMWQYSNSGQISGISGKVDLDYWYGAPLSGTHQHTYHVAAQTDATCTQPGQITYVCDCGATKTETTAALGHSYENGKCTACGQRDPKILLGDLTGDGKRTSADAVLLVRYLSELEQLTDAQRLAADMNGDGSITSADAVALVRLLAGLI